MGKMKPYMHEYLEVWCAADCEHLQRSASGHSRLDSSVRCILREVQTLQGTDTSQEEPKPSWSSMKFVTSLTCPTKHQLHQFKLSVNIWSGVSACCTWVAVETSTSWRLKQLVAARSSFLMETNLHQSFQFQSKSTCSALHGLQCIPNGFLLVKKATAAMSRSCVMLFGSRMPRHTFRALNHGSCQL